MRLVTRKQMRLAYSRYRINKFFKQVETRGVVVNGKAYLLVYNDKAPEKSYILTEQL
jgi:hypothetical protein